jgi:hypothetical protein
MLGCSQAVRHQTLNLAFRWSDPTHPSQYRKEAIYPMDDDYDFMLYSIAEYFGSETKSNQDSEKDPDQYSGDDYKKDYR